MDDITRDKLISIKRQPSWDYARVRGDNAWEVMQSLSIEKELHLITENETPIGVLAAIIKEDKVVDVVLIAFVEGYDVTVSKQAIEFIDCLLIKYGSIKWSVHNDNHFKASCDRLIPRWNLKTKVIGDLTIYSNIP